MIFFWVWVSVFSTPVFIVSKPIKAHFEDNFPDIFAEMVEAWNGRPPAFGDPDPEPAANAAGRWHATAPGWICLVQGSWEWRFSLLGRAPCETGVFFSLFWWFRCICSLSSPRFRRKVQCYEHSLQVCEDSQRVVCRRHWRYRNGWIKGVFMCVHISMYINKQYINIRNIYIYIHKYIYILHIIYIYYIYIYMYYIHIHYNIYYIHIYI